MQQVLNGLKTFRPQHRRTGRTDAFDVCERCIESEGQYSSLATQRVYRLMSGRLRKIGQIGRGRVNDV